MMVPTTLTVLPSSMCRRAVFHTSTNRMMVIFEVPTTLTVLPSSMCRRAVLADRYQLNDGDLSGSHDADCTAL
jgi:hypothetical protein